MKEIAEKVNIVEEIARQTKQQLDQVIQQNAADAGELSRSAEHLTGFAEQLQNEIGYFQVRACSLVSFGLWRR